MIGLFCLLVGLVGGQENPDLDESEGSGAGDDDEYAANTTYVRFNYTGRIRPWPVPAGITEVRELLVTITRTAKFMPPGVRSSRAVRVPWVEPIIAAVVLAHSAVHAYVVGLLPQIMVTAWSVTFARAHPLCSPFADYICV